MKKNPRSFWFLVGGILILAILAAANLQTARTEDVPLSKVLDEVKADQVDRIQVDGDKLTVSLKNTSTKQTSFKESGASLTDYGVDFGKVTIDPRSGDSNTSAIFGFLSNFLPVMAIIALIYFFMRGQQNAGNQAMSFGKSRARLFGPDKKKITFNEVAGETEAKQELTEIVEFLKFPKKFEDLGAKIPKGVLLFGPPGTGKTLLARAVAGEANVPFFSISGSEFVEMFVGVGASRVRDLFAKAKKNAPCIIFIDEIDAVGRQRGTGMGGGHDEREQTLNQILVEMDGFEQGTNVIVMAATNRPDVLDPALLRPGRFDRRVTLDNPDLVSREAILAVHVVGKPLDKDVDLKTIAKKTPGFSGADLANLVNEGAILAARLGQKKITQKNLSEAVEKVLMGPERKSHVMNEEEKKITAYHEAGHAIVSHVLPNCHPVHKVTIVSRGSAGGFTWSLPLEDRHLNSVADFKDDLAMMLGGRMAEKLVFGEITTGASNDLQNASNLARRMIMDFGMSKKLTNRVFGSQSDAIFLGRDLGSEKNYSEEVAKVIDDEVAELIDEAAKRAADVITKHRADVDKIADKLIADETIDGPEFEKLVGAKRESSRIVKEPITISE